MKNFSLELDNKSYQVKVIGPMDKYGENNQTHFSEVPLVEFNSEDGKFIRYDVIDVLDFESDIFLPNNDKPVPLDGRDKIKNKLFEIYPENYLNTFIRLKRTKKPKM